jgi:hypothetical protein
VEDIWKTPTGDVVALDKVLFKLKKVNFFLRGWGYNLSGSRNKRKKEILEALFVLEEMEVATPPRCGTNQKTNRLEDRVI